MNELKLLIEMVANLPSLAVWVLVGYLCYQISIIGSIYGLARLAIDRLYRWKTTPVERNIDVRLLIDGMCITGTQDKLIRQLDRVRMHGRVPHMTYLHSTEIDWLERAIDDKIEKDKVARA